MGKKKKIVLTVVLSVLGLLAAAYIILYFVGKSQVDELEDLNSKMKQQIEKLQQMKAEGKL